HPVDLEPGELFELLHGPAAVELDRPLRREHLAEQLGRLLLVLEEASLDLRRVDVAVAHAASGFADPKPEPVVERRLPEVGFTRLAETGVRLTRPNDEVQDAVRNERVPEELCQPARRDASKAEVDEVGVDVAVGE